MRIDCSRPWLYCILTFYRDPTSAFFDPSRAYEQIYSLERRQHAEAFIRSTKIPTDGKNITVTLQIPMICIGIATIERPGEQYIRSTLGSLMDGLEEDERKHIHTIVLIGHTDPHRHPVFHEPWLQALSDVVLIYNSTNKEQFENLRNMEQEKDYQQKAVLDYTYLLEECIKSGATWIAMIEDDTLAVADWYPRTIHALDLANSKRTDWLYLRLFFTEQFFGWNVEFWPTYLLSSVTVFASVAALLLLLRRARYPVVISNVVILMVCFVCTPACILLYFMAGRLSMRPMVPGLHEMPNFGCCAQGLVFSSEVAVRVVGKLRERGLGFVDMILEEWANKENLTRFAVIPSVLQHVGRHSSKGDDFGIAEPWSAAERIFNFAFELYEQHGQRVVHPIFG
ncbi:MAG: hypothetical protein Q9179_007585 [Wetmoreana sp. 5 TL-2023]